MLVRSGEVYMMRSFGSRTSPLVSWTMAQLSIQAFSTDLPIVRPQIRYSSRQPSKREEDWDILYRHGELDGPDATWPCDCRVLCASLQPLVVWTLYAVTVART